MARLLTETIGIEPSYLRTLKNMRAVMKTAPVMVARKKNIISETDSNG
jgi:hypothetical protein